MTNFKGGFISTAAISQNGFQKLYNDMDKTILQNIKTFLKIDLDSMRFSFLDLIINTLIIKSVLKNVTLDTTIDIRYILANLTRHINIFCNKSRKIFKLYDCHNKSTQFYLVLFDILLNIRIIFMGTIFYLQF